MVEIIDLDLIKYKHIYLTSDGVADYAELIKNINYDASFSPNIINALIPLFCNHDAFDLKMLCTLMTEIKNANIQDGVKLYIESLYNFESEKHKSHKVITFPTHEHDAEWELYNGLPPQVFQFFKHIAETPNQMNKFDVLSVLGIIQDTNISPVVTNFINNIIDLSQIENESDLKAIIKDESLYQDSLFKRYIHD
jgi:hypothetical protein